MTAMQELAQAQAVQFIPQVIMAGHDIGAMPRDELRNLAINAPFTLVGEAITLMAIIVDGAKREAGEL